MFSGSAHILWRSRAWMHAYVESNESKIRQTSLTDFSFSPRNENTRDHVTPIKNIEIKVYLYVKSTTGMPRKLRNAVWSLPAPGIDNFGASGLNSISFGNVLILKGVTAYTISLCKLWRCLIRWAECKKKYSISPSDIYFPIILFPIMNICFQSDLHKVVIDVAEDPGWRNVKYIYMSQNV